MPCVEIEGPPILAWIDAIDGFPLHRRAPFDRLLIAQAHREGLTLVTHDPQCAVVLYSTPDQHLA
jgi:PIN domain nuclease of toxin-antitoxin system